MHRVLLVVCLVVCLVACSKSKQKNEPAGSASGTTPAALPACDEAAVRAAVDQLGKEQFPDNASVAWSTLAVRAVAGITYAEVQPSSDEVGSPKFIFAIVCKDGATTPKVQGTYAFDKGAYTLLATADSSVPLAKTPPGTPNGAATESTTSSTDPSASSAVPSAAPGAVAVRDVCPMGRWQYDITWDRSLEQITNRNSPAARVVSKRGMMTCTVTGQERGSFVCAVDTGGIENIFETPDGLRITLQITGTYKFDFEPTGPGHWKTSNVGLGLQVTATTAGMHIPVPTTLGLPGAPDSGGNVDWRCEGDTLQLNPRTSTGVTSIKLRRLSRRDNENPGPCSPSIISERLGVPLGTSRFELNKLDDDLGNRNLRDLIENIAREVGIDPGLLAATALAENEAGVYLGRDRVESVAVGLDNWDAHGASVRRDVPAARRIETERLDVEYVNEQDAGTGNIHVFRNGRDALLAVAAWLRYQQNKLERDVPGFAGLPPAVRFAAQRLAFNKGYSHGRQFAQDAVENRDPFERSGPADFHHPKRTATIWSAVALHVSQAFFGNSHPCPKPPL